MPEVRQRSDPARAKPSGFPVLEENEAYFRSIFESAAIGMAGGSETILVVEDEAS